MSRTHYCAACLNSFQRDAEVCPNLSCQQARPERGWGILLGKGDHFDRHYLIDKRIAVAGAGICYRAFETDHDGNTTGPALAIKVLYTSRDSGPYLRRLAAEAQILQDLAHKHIVECRGFVNRLGHNPYLITRFEEGGSLYDHIRHVGALPISVAAAVTRQVLLALDVAHQRGVVHRDLKPQNVLIRTHVKREETPHTLVADFGIAKVAGTLHEGLTQVGTFVGTPEFAAPEQFLGEAPAAATDVFAAGGMLYFMLTGSPPVRFTHRSDAGTSLRELLQQTPPKVPRTAGTATDCDQIDQLLTGMMQKEIGARWTVQQIVAFLARFEGSQPLRGDGDTLPLTGDGELHTMVAGDFDLEDEPEQLPVGDNPTMSPANLGMEEEDDEEDEPIPAQAPPPAPRPTRMRLPRKTEELKIAQPEPARSTSLDDLFGGGSTTTESSQASRSDLSLDDLFAEPAAAQEPAPRVPREPAPKLAPEPVHELAPQPSDRPAEPEPISHWEPTDPQPSPPDLPDDTAALLRLLGSVRAEERASISTALESRRDLSTKLNGYRGGDAALGCGIALAFAMQGWTSCANAARRMLQDSDPGVRACAAEAVGVIGSASMLTSLSRLISDSDVQVRAAAARALAVAGVSQGRQSLARGWIAPLQNDADPSVRATWKRADADLG